MDTNTVRQIFHEKFNGQTNFITHWVIRYGKRGIYLYELSRGKFMSDTLYGVTVLTTDGQRTELSECFDRLDKAENYIATLRG